MIRIGIDLGGTNIAVGAVDDGHAIVSRVSVPTLARRPAAEVVGDMGDAVEAALAKARSRSLETVGRRLQDIYRREGVLPQEPQPVPAVSALNLLSKNSFPGRM